MNRIFLFAFLLSATDSIAQDFIKFCGKDTLFFDNGNKEHFALVLHTPYREYQSLNALPQSIRKINSEYLQKRVGNIFVKNRIRINACYIVDFADSSTVKNKKWISIANKAVKYAVQYSFQVEKGMKYYFTTVFDSTGTILSKGMLPDFSSNHDFDKIISMCNAKKIAEGDGYFSTKTWYETLEFSDSANAFVWVVRQQPITEKVTNQEIQRTIYIHANSGKIIHREEEVVSSACDGNTPPLIDLRKPE